MDIQASYNACNPAALRQLVAQKARLKRMPKDVIDTAFKEAMGHYEELSSSNPNWKKVYTDFASFRHERNLWFRFSESQFDRYMQSTRL